MQEEGNFLACYKHWDRYYPNSGVMFARPSTQVLQGLRDVVRRCNSDPSSVYRDGSYRGYPIWTYTNVDGQEIQLSAGFHQRKTSCWSDQAVVDTYFTRISAASNNLDRAYTPLSSTFNTIAYEAYQNLGARTVQDLAHVVVLHFVFPKPWNAPECDLWWGLQPWCQIWRDAPLE